MNDIDDAIAARVGPGIRLGIGPRVASAADRGANAKILLRPHIRIEARYWNDLGSSSALDLHLVSSILELLSKWRTLAQCRALPVNDIDRNDKGNGDAD
jgi:hypothetical protein